MAQPDIVKGSYLDLLIQTAPGPPAVFTPFCGLTTRTFTQQINTNDTFVPDCDDPEFVPVRRLVPTGRQWDISGEGLYNLNQETIVRQALGVTKNYRYKVGRPVGSIIGTGYYAGPAMITNLQMGGTTGSGEFGTVSMTIASDGEWLWVPAV